MILDFSWLPSVTAIAGQSLSCLWILQQWHSPIPYRLYLVLQPSCSYDDPPKETAASLCSLCWEEEGEKMGATKQGWIRLCVCGEGVGDGGFAPAPSTSSEKYSPPPSWEGLRVCIWERRVLRIIKSEEGREG